MLALIIFMVAVAMTAYFSGVLEILGKALGWFEEYDDEESDNEERVFDPELAIIMYQIQQLKAAKSLVNDAFANQDDNPATLDYSPGSSSASIATLQEVPLPQLAPSPSRARHLHPPPQPRYSNSPSQPQPHPGHVSPPPQPRYYSYPPPFTATTHPPDVNSLIPKRPTPLRPSRTAVLTNFFVNAASSAADGSWLPTFPTFDFSGIMEAVRQCNAVLQYCMAEERRMSLQAIQKPEATPPFDNRYSDVDHDMEDQVMEGLEDANMRQSVNTHTTESPPPAELVPLPSPQLQAAMANQAALQQKLEALIDLQQQFQSAYTEAAHQFLMEWAQILIGQVRATVEAVENAKNPLVAQYESCLRFWYVTLDEIAKRNPSPPIATSTTAPHHAQPVQQEPTPPPPPPSPSPAEEEDAQKSQQAFFEFMLAGTSAGDRASGKHALRYPAVHARHTQEEKGTTTFPSESGSEDVLAGSKDDARCRVKRDRKLPMDAHLKERIRRLRAEKEMARFQCEVDPFAAASTTHRTRRRDDIDGPCGVSDHEARIKNKRLQPIRLGSSESTSQRKHDLRMRRREERKKEKENAKMSVNVRRMCRSITMKLQRRASDSFMSF